jgi:hypothetical protein
MDECFRRRRRRDARIALAGRPEPGSAKELSRSRESPGVVIPRPAWDPNFECWGSASRRTHPGPVAGPQNATIRRSNGPPGSRGGNRYPVPASHRPSGRSFRRQDAASRRPARVRNAGPTILSFATGPASPPQYSFPRLGAGPVPYRRDKRRRDGKKPGPTYLAPPLAKRRGAIPGGMAPRGTRRAETA